MAVVVTGNIKGFDGVGKSAVTVTFKVNQRSNPFPTGDFGSQELKTDTSGDFTVTLQEEILYVVRIPSLPVERTILIVTGTTGPIDLFDFWHAEDTALNFYGDDS